MKYALNIKERHLSFEIEVETPYKKKNISKYKFFGWKIYAYKLLRKKEIFFEIKHAFSNSTTSKY